MTVTAEYIKAALEFAPRETPPAPTDLLGFWLQGETQQFFVCATCSGRMTARGCSLGSGVIPVWGGLPSREFGATCTGCGGVK